MMRGQSVLIIDMFHSCVVAQESVQFVRSMGEILCYFAPMGGASVLGATADVVEIFKDRTKVP